MRMTTGLETVRCQLYTDSKHTASWGHMVDTASKIGNGASQSRTIYGRIPMQTIPTLGSYLDAMTVTVTY